MSPPCLPGVARGGWERLSRSPLYPACLSLQLLCAELLHHLHTAPDLLGALGTLTQGCVDPGVVAAVVARRQQVDWAALQAQVQEGLGAQRRLEELRGSSLPPDALATVEAKTEAAAPKCAQEPGESVNPPPQQFCCPMCKAPPGHSVRAGAAMVRLLTDAPLLRQVQPGVGDACALCERSLRDKLRHLDKSQLTAVIQAVKAVRGCATPVGLQT